MILPDRISQDLASIETILSILATLFAAFLAALAYIKRTILKIFDNHLAHFEKRGFAHVDASAQVLEKASLARHTDLVLAIRDEGKQTRETMRDLARRGPG
jgi:hypothetical protein